MTAEDLNTYLKDPSLLHKGTLDDLKYMVDNYPYAHTFVFLYLYNLALVEDIRYFAELQRLAPFLADRNKLYVMVEKKYIASSSSSREEHSSDSFASVDRFLEQMEEKGASAVSLPADFVSSSGDYFSIHGISSDATLQTEGGETLAALHQDISLTPQNAAVPAVELTQAVGEPDDADAPIFTETLARLYIEQHCYDKALSIILSMKDKNPEKSSYFADQIRFLERLIEISK
ncbi:hypothetical protein [Porphyromonas circumdentaria]|uniref:Tetratricopeptide repeat-containing protein n=1 Tax=Porphyromonas circumdentaria TaxID=29524 RepID=A0A1T4MNB4_9PORP|nr:hypothetical protein [Porphyromonas circumdentaria]MBB6275885.1 hypothetical protein [Porphyromonas circumdentaria]MDO4722667.1 tetratricopeptide repeat protein [Porphyromonas circumdentaria]SJZ68327.1 hypothetical protein SAMN02745171_00845 [Porphyromonas circumdentaria]